MDLSALHPPTPGLLASVVVPARDEEELIGACIEALCGQRGVEPGSWEVLLVLDGCTDETEARALDAAAGRVGPFTRSARRASAPAALARRAWTSPAAASRWPPGTAG